MFVILSEIFVVQILIIDELQKGVGEETCPCFLSSCFWTWVKIFVSTCAQVAGAGPFRLLAAAVREQLTDKYMGPL